MSARLEEARLLAFNEELSKLGAPAWHNALGGGAAGFGVGALGGGLLGAGLGAVQKYRQAKEQGEGTGSALRAGLGGVVPGAAQGALAGGALGSLGGAAAGALRPEAIGKLTSRAGPIGGSARAGQRALHGVTGWTPEEGIRSIRGGAYNAEKAFAAAPHSDQARKAFEAASEAESRGLTSIPGFVKAVGKEGLLPTVKADLANTWHSGGVASKLLSFGVPGALGANELYRASTDPAAEGHRGEMIGKAVGNIGGGLVGSAMPMPASTLIGGALGSAGGRIGRGVDFMHRKIRGHVGTPPPAHQAEPTPAGEHAPIERVMSPSAAGLPPESAVT